jgi:hypothetical protein
LPTALSVQIAQRASLLDALPIRTHHGARPSIRAPYALFKLDRLKVRLRRMG